MGYHYGPCRKTTWPAVMLLIAIGISIMEGTKHAKGAGRILEVLEITAISLAVGTVTSIVCALLLIRHRRKKQRHQIMTDRSIELLTKEWVALPTKDREAPEWDFLRKALELKDTEKSQRRP